MKRTLAIILTLVLLVSVCPLGLFTITASAATTYTDHSTGFQFTLVNSKANIVGYLGTETNLVIPSVVTYGTQYDVRYIGDYAFTYCASLTSITIPDGVTSIGGSVFYGCSNLTSITVDSNNKYYSSQDGVLFNKDKTRLIQYPAGKASTTYTIPDGVTSIGYSVFSDCISLTSITIPDSVTSIDSNAFRYCSSLKTVYYGGTEARWNAISINDDNDPLLNADIKFCHSYEMVKEGSIRREGVNKYGKYQSAGVRYKGRLSKEMHESATEIGFIAAPTHFLNGMTLSEYYKSENNVAITAKVKAEGMKDLIYAPITDENGRNYYDYQLVITGLTREGVTENILDTEISACMYAKIDGETIYTETMAYSYNDIAALYNK